MSFKPRIVIKSDRKLTRRFTFTRALNDICVNIQPPVKLKRKYTRRLPIEKKTKRKYTRRSHPEDTPERPKRKYVMKNRTRKSEVILLPEPEPEVILLEPEVIEVEPEEPEVESAIKRLFKEFVYEDEVVEDAQHDCENLKKMGFSPGLVAEHTEVLRILPPKKKRKFVVEDEEEAKDPRLSGIVHKLTKRLSI